MRRLSNGKWDGVVYLNDVTVNYFNKGLNSGRRLGYTRDIVRPITPVFYFHKRSFLTQIFSQKIEICRESGLIAHWTAQYKRQGRKHEQRKPKKLDLSNIVGIVQISAVLYIIAFIVFMMEVYGSTIGCIKKVLDYLTY